MTRPVALITGSTRGIGFAIAKKLAQQGYNIVVTGKTVEPHPKLKGTLSSAAQELMDLGAYVVAFEIDVREHERIVELMQAVEQQFGRLDVLVNNASALDLTPTEDLSMKRFDLLHQVNGRATFACTQAALPLLKKSPIGRVINICPEPKMTPRFFERHIGYTLSKYAMSLCVLGFAHEFKKEGIAVHGLWPKTVIATSAVEFTINSELLPYCRKPEVMADALWALLQKDKDASSGQFFLDEDLLAEQGVSDFSHYNMSDKQPLPDFYTDDFRW